ncbi:MAG: NUDIX hydrolase [Planctomycetes bacterium]|nr:NUDIX hydrolase [Planctomycetota bacterium]
MNADNIRPLRHAIVAIINDSEETLLIERGRNDTYPGYWSSVTGSLDGDESQQAAIIREAHEEVGLNVRPMRKLWESVTRGAHFVLHWWLCELADSCRNCTPQPEEVEDTKWVKYADLETVTPMFSDTRHFFRDIYPEAIKNKVKS